jgi:hypothetical protein
VLAVAMYAPAVRLPFIFDDYIQIPHTRLYAAGRPLAYDRVSQRLAPDSGVQVGLGLYFRAYIKR